MTRELSYLRLLQTEAVSAFRPGERAIHFPFPIQHVDTGRWDPKNQRPELLNLYDGRVHGDNLRHGLSGDVGFDAGSRAENVRRAGEAGRMLADAGLVVEVFVDTPLEVCEQRDRKGLYRHAGAGTLHGLTGVDDPYEPPPDPDLVLDGTRPIQDGVTALEAMLGERGLL